MLTLSLGKTCQRDAQSKGKLSLGRLPIPSRWLSLGPAWFYFFWRTVFFSPLVFHDLGFIIGSQVTPEELPFPRSQVTKYLSFYKKNFIFFNRGTPCPNHVYVTMGTHTHPTMQSISKHNLRHIFGLSVNPFVADAGAFFPLSPETQRRLFL